MSDKEADDRLGPTYTPIYEPSEEANTSEPQPVATVKTNDTPESVKAVQVERIPLSKLEISQKGIDFIVDWEKLRLDYYDDSDGFCTVGIGHLVAKKSCKALGLNGKTITRDEALKLFPADLEVRIKQVHSSVKVPLLQHEYDALCSLVFNMGSFKPAPSLLKKLNAGDYTVGPAKRRQPA
jgi:GH24 family phage-related lysozyme (muramidase)